MSGKSRFGRLAGLISPARASETTAEDEEEDDDEMAAAKDDDDEDMTPSSEDSAETDDAAHAARRRERARCARIFASREAVGRVAMAAELAFATDLSSAEAVRVLASSPSAQPPRRADRLDQAMAKLPDAGVGSGAEAGKSDDDGWREAYAKAGVLGSNRT